MFAATNPPTPGSLWRVNYHDGKGMQEGLQAYVLDEEASDPDYVVLQIVTRRLAGTRFELPAPGSGLPGDGQWVRLIRPAPRRPKVAKKKATKKKARRRRAPVRKKKAPARRRRAAPAAAPPEPPPTAIPPPPPVVELPPGLVPPFPFAPPQLGRPKSGELWEVETSGVRWPAFVKRYDRKGRVFEVVLEYEGRPQGEPELLDASQFVAKLRDAPRGGFRSVGRNPGRDERMRELERRARAGDTGSIKQLLVERARVAGRAAKFGLDMLEDYLRLFPGQTEDQISGALGKRKSSISGLLDKLERQCRASFWGSKHEGRRQGRRARRSRGGWALKRKRRHKGKEVAPPPPATWYARPDWAAGFSPDEDPPWPPDLFDMMSFDMHDLVLHVGDDSVQPDTRRRAERYLRTAPGRDTLVCTMARIRSLVQHARASGPAFRRESTRYDPHPITIDEGVIRTLEEAYGIIGRVAAMGGAARLNNVWMLVEARDLIDRAGIRAGYFAPEDYEPEEE